jgi:flagellar P-ring protein precursor FlgI
VDVDEEKGRQLITLRSGASLSSLVAGLNTLGVTPRDMISILQAIKTAGALQADIEVM